MRKMLILPAMFLALTAAAYEFKDFLNEHRGDMWKLNQTQFAAAFVKTAQFIPSDKSVKELRYALTNRKGQLKIGDMLVYEALAAFEENTLNRITVLIFSRGDGGHWDQDNVTFSIEKITALMKEYYPDIVPAKDYYNMARQKINALNWKTPEGNYQLKWSLSGAGKNAQCEYFTFIIDKDQFAPLQEAAKITVKKDDLKTNVQTNKDGYRYLDIPMVDQGQKGYCVVAVLERILRYYGSEFNQHQLAQLANTEVYGTSRDDMVEAIKKADSRVGVRMRQLFVSDDFYKVSDFLRMVDDYNRAAKKVRKKTINPDEYKIVMGNSYTYDIGRLMSQMDSATFVESKARDKRELGKFVENIKKNIDSGVPLGWCVLLGLVQEKKQNPQPGGGHMRLITGYNDAKQEIVFSDSWGLNHEFKTMSYQDAWAMTTWLAVLTPRDRQGL